MLAPVEADRARVFYREVRSDDGRLGRVQRQAVDLVARLTGRAVADIGSFGLRINLPGSDLDLGIGCPDQDLASVASALAGHAQCHGVAATRFGVHRVALSCTIEGVLVDVSVLSERDFASAREMIARVDQGMSDTERIAYTWVKRTLREWGETARLEAWKLAPFERFCPDLLRCG